MSKFGLLFHVQKRLMIRRSMNACSKEEGTSVTLKHGGHARLVVWRFSVASVGDILKLHDIVKKEGYRDSLGKFRSLPA